MIYRADGRLRDFWSFDSETYLINDNLSSPRAVCGSFASNVFPDSIRERIEKAGPERGFVVDQHASGLTVALVDADLYVDCMADALSRAWTSRHDGEDALLLAAHNAPYDLATTLQRARLMEITDRALDWQQVAETTGLPASTYEELLHMMFLDVMDIDGTGLPDSPCHLLDGSIREKLILIASGEGGVDGEKLDSLASLGTCVMKYLGEDRSDDKKGAPCRVCQAKGTVTETFDGCNRKACVLNKTPQEGVSAGEPCRGKYTNKKDPDHTAETYLGEPCERPLKTMAKKVECPRCKGAKYDTPWRLRYGELDGVPINEWPKKAKDYAIDDAVDEVLVLVGQAGKVGENSFDPGGDHVVVDEFGAVKNEAFQVRSAWGLKLAQMAGPRADADYYEEYRRQTVEHQKEAFRIGREMGFIRPDGTRDTKVHGALIADAYQRIGKDVPLTPSGKISTSDDTIQQSGDDRLIYYQEHKVKDYTEVIALGLDYALAADPGVLKATGRTSWKKYMHQPPRKGIFRECWVPRPGNVFLSCDWTAAEMVALSQILLFLFGESAMAEAINAGKDLHIMLGVTLWNMDPRHVGDQIDYDEFERRYIAGDKLIKSFRQSAKVGNFGFPGGLQSLVDWARGMGIILTDKESDAIRSAWLETWFSMQGYLDMWRDEARDAGGFGFTYLQWVTGRVRGRVPRWTVGCNTGFQGLVADAIKLVMWWTVREMYTPCANGWLDTEVDYPHSVADPFTPRKIGISVPAGRVGLKHGLPRSPLYGWRAWLWIHDEGLLEGPEETADAAGRRFSALMVKALSYFCPDLKTAADPALMRRWYKDAEPVYEGEGDERRLVPWEPT